MDLYCSLSGQHSELVKPIFYSSDYRLLEEAEDEQPDWMNNVEKPVLEFLSHVDEHCLYAEVPEEMVIQLSEPETKSMDESNQNMQKAVRQYSYSPCRRHKSEISLTV